MAALAADALVGHRPDARGSSGALPLPWWQMLAIFGYAMVSCLVVNDAVKVAMIKRLVPAAVAGEFCSGHRIPVMDLADKFFDIGNPPSPRLPLSVNLWRESLWTGKKQFFGQRGEKHAFLRNEPDWFLLFFTPKQQSHNYLG